MQKLSDSIKHLRSIHLVFVLASVAIAMAIFSSDSMFGTAIKQLRDVVRLRDALTEARIASSISDASDASGYQDNLEKFVETSLLEYLEAKEVFLDSATLTYLLVDLSDERDFGHVANIDPYEAYEHRAQDKQYWFGWQLSLLVGDTRLYAHPDDLALFRPTKRTTLRDYSSFLNRLLQADTLYIAPTFHSSYLSDGVVAERYPLPDADWERLSEMENAELSVKLTKVKFTNEESRGVFKASQEHAQEDPVAYTDYDFEFDTLTLEVRASARSTRSSVSFTLKLPVMFRVREPTFMGDVLQHASFDQAYYARYLSSSRSFERLFPELAEATSHLRSATPEDLERYLEERARSGGAPISLLGLQIRRDLIEVWGVAMMLCVQLYFCMHYRAFINQKPDNSELPVAWIGLYRDPISSAVFQISIALPLIVCCLVAFAPGQQSHFRAIQLVWPIAAIVLLVWTEVLYVRFRRAPA